MRGTLLNTATVTVGAGLGLAAHNVIPPSYEPVVIEGLGLVVCLFGIKMFFSSKNPLISVAAIALGGLIGVWMGIAPALDIFAEWVRHRVGGGSSFNEGLITSFVLFCVGPMTLLGCLQDGIEGKIEILSVKSALDGFASIFLAAALGWGVMVTALILLLFQGTLTLLARSLQKVAADEELLGEESAVGGAMMLGIGIGLLGLKKMRVETYLPALVLAPAFTLLARQVRSQRTASV